jgi:SAM-dependent methyltransferase
MARLVQRRLRRFDRAYLTHRALWAALERQLAAAKADIASTQRGDVPLVLDLGCGHKPYAELFAGLRHVGVNLDAVDASPDLIADATALPLADGSVDLVFCTQVLEHVPRPAALLAEAARVLRPGGRLVLSVPFYWPLHEEPHDYFRFTPHGLRELLGAAGLEALCIEPDTGAVTQAAVSVIEALPRWALALVPLINLVTPALQALSGEQRSTLNWVLTARRGQTWLGHVP